MVLVISTASAEPDAAVKWLMSDTVTMFDWGIESLNRQFSEDLRDSSRSWWRKPWRLAAEYDFLTDRIYIVSRFEKTDMSETQFRNWCETAFSNIRGLMRVDENGVATIYDEHFSHQGLQRADRPADLAERLSKITILIARGDDGDTAHICETQLGQESISYRSEVGAENAREPSVAD